MHAAALLCGLAPVVPCLAQTSTSYKLREATFNDGGDPTQGMSLASARTYTQLDQVFRDYQTVRGAGSDVRAWDSGA